MMVTKTIHSTAKELPEVFPPELRSLPFPTNRVRRLRDNILNTVQEIDIERARYATRSYQRTENEPLVIRRAKMLFDIVKEMQIKIDPDDLIVGNRSYYPRMGIIAPEGAVDWVDKELDTLPYRPQDKFQIRSEYIRELREEIFPYWRGKTLEDIVAVRMPEDVKRMVKARAFSVNQTDHAQGHILPNVEGWLTHGIDGIRERLTTAEKKHANLTEDNRDFYQAGSIVLDAAELFMKRYADMAQHQAQNTTDADRRLELENIAQNCEWLSQHPAKTFWQGAQAVWFLFVLMEIESNASSMSPGRLDQYLFPYLDRDLNQGLLELPQAQDILENLWLKFNEIVLLRSTESARFFAGFPIGFNIVVGGQTVDGRDATNLLSYMCLRAQADLGMPQPNFSIRIYENSPQQFLEAAAYVIGQASGMPQVFNDAVVIPGQQARGISREDAYNYAVVGCVELSTPGKTLGWSDASMFNLVRVLELTLFGGRDPQTDEQIGLETPTLNEMKSFEELEDAYDRQLQFFVELMVKGCDTVDKIHGEVYQSPFLSMVIDDCIDRGLDVTAGGAHYNFSGVQGVQIANVADSFMSIKQAIFEEKWIGSAELLEILRNNFEGVEVLRQRLVNKVPKYGNDDDRVDQYAKKWGDRFSELVVQYPTVRGGIYQPGFYTVSAHVPMGAHVGATPDGRVSGAPLADGGLSPTAGRDRKGATAVLRSVSKIDLSLATNGTLLNMKFLPSFFEGKHALSKFAAFLRGFSALKIPHVQFNVVSADALRDAQQHPEEFRHLVVRVAGYSAYFVELDTDLQNEIIQRTEFSSI